MVSYQPGQGGKTDGARHVQIKQQQVELRQSVDIGLQRRNISDGVEFGIGEVAGNHLRDGSAEQGVVIRYQEVLLLVAHR
jgi:hypothetical protein